MPQLAGFHGTCLILDLCVFETGKLPSFADTDFFGEEVSALPNRDRRTRRRADNRWSSWLGPDVLLELAREFEPSAEALPNRVAQAERDSGEPTDGLRTEARQGPPLPSIGGESVEGVAQPQPPDDQPWQRRARLLRADR